MSQHGEEPNVEKMLVETVEKMFVKTLASASSRLHLKKILATPKEAFGKKHLGAHASVWSFIYIMVSLQLFFRKLCGRCDLIDQKRNLKEPSR